MLVFLLQSIALTGGTVHHFAPEHRAQPATVLIEDGRIAAVGSQVELPPDCEQIDVTGRHLIPGLIDGAINHDSDHDALYVAAGVTFVRDTGNDLTRILVERQTEARDRVPGPALHIAGPVLDGSQAATTEAAILRTEHDAEARLPYLFEAQVDYLATHLNLPVEAWRKTIELAHEHDLQVWGPAPLGQTLADVARAGQDGLIGMQALLPPGTGWHQAQLADLEPALERMRQSDIAVTPHLNVFGRMTRDYSAELDAEKSILGLLGPLYERAWRSEAETWQVYQSGPGRALADAALQLQAAALKSLFDRGVRLVPGSGAPNSWLVPGSGLLDELEHWERAGIPAASVLRCATIGAAGVLDVAAERGSLTEGKVADIVVLGSDPTRGLAALRRPTHVVVRGRVLTRADLNGLVGDLRERQTARKAELAKPIEVSPPELPEGDLVLSGRAELRALGQVVTAERFAVVHTFDGFTAYLTHMVTPSAATSDGVSLHMEQRFKDRKLQSFSVAVGEQDEAFTVQGKLIGNLLNIERRQAGLFIDNNRAPDPVTLVDVRSILTEIIAAQYLLEGKDRAIGFQGIETTLDLWQMRVAEDGHLAIATQEGAMACGFDERGVPLFAYRQFGNAQSEMRLSDVKTYGGPGLPLPSERVYTPPADGEAAEAAHDHGTEQGGDD